MTDAVGFDVNAMFELMAKTIENKGTKLNDELKDMSTKDSLSDQQMLRIQFSVNQYNTLLETASSITKALVDEAKQLAQRAS